MFKHILVTLDGSTLSESILPYVNKLAEGGAPRVTLLTVLHNPEPIRGSAQIHDEGLTDAAGQFVAVALQHRHVVREGETYEQAVERARDEGLTYLHECARRLEAAGGVHCEVEFGDDAAEVIADYARRHDVDLIAMATHGRSGLSRLVSGSVASKVLEKAGLPVLLVRPPA
jgi:nucleotide-binding universal stress UspA family protein